jgi:hypothetical protein
MTFTDHIDVIVGRASATLGFLRRLAREFEDPYTLKTLFISLVRPKLDEYASCVWDPIYEVHSAKIERKIYARTAKTKSILLFFELLRTISCLNF